MWLIIRIFVSVCFYTKRYRLREKERNCTSSIWKRSCQKRNGMLTSQIQPYKKKDGAIIWCIYLSNSFWVLSGLYCSYLPGKCGMLIGWYFHSTYLCALTYFKQWCTCNFTLAIRVCPICDFVCLRTCVISSTYTNWNMDAYQTKSWYIQQKNWQS